MQTVKALIKRYVRLRFIWVNIVLYDPFWGDASYLLGNMNCFHQNKFVVGGGRVMRWCWVNFQCLLIWIRVGQRPSARTVGAGGGCLDIFLSSIISLFFLPLYGRRPDID